ARLERKVRERTNELQAQTKRLSTLYALAVTLSRSLNLEQILSAALAKVLQLRNLKAGWVILERDSAEENGERYLVTHHGLSMEFASREAKASFDDCICREAFRSGKAFVAEINEKSCPWSELARTEEIRCHACIPLRSKNRVLGVMNLVAYDGDLFSEEELDLLTAIGHQMGTAIENAGLYQEIQRREALRSQLLEELIEAREEERKRIARELHDEFAQRLSALAMSAEIAEKAVPVRMGCLKERLRKSKELALQTLDETRDLILSLRPTMLDDLGLVAAIRWCVENELEGSGVSFLVESNGFDRALPAGIEIALFRIIQEAVRNVVKHAAAQKVEIRLELREGLVTATVADDGQGFEVRKVLASKEGPSLGLIGMKERAEFLGGQLTIDSQPGQGTRIRVTVPVKELEAE
ncbi:MAG: GAF domain-containing sensor histidine kinase, partial [Anaerolineae bacterium]